MPIKRIVIIFAYFVFFYVFLNQSYKNVLSRVQPAKLVHNIGVARSESISFTILSRHG